MFFRIRLLLAMGESRGEIDVLLLASKSVSYPGGAEISHIDGVKTHFLAELPACQLFWVFNCHFPTPLRQFQCAFLNGVTELLDQPDAIAVDGKNDRRFILFDHTIDAALAIGAKDLVLAQAHPGVAIDLTAGKGGDGEGNLR